MTGPISFRPTSPAATPTTPTPIQRSALLNAPPAPPPPPPVRSPQAFQRSTAASGSRPLDLQAEAASINTAITQANPEQIQANAARLNQLGLVPQGMPGITPAALQTARQNLKPVSQHQVFNVHDKHESDASRSTVVESGRSVKLKQGGSPFGVGIVLKPGATVEVLGHGSPDGRTIGGKTPQQLAKQLKAGGATQLAVLDLKSCHSEAFKAELEQCLASEGIQVGQIKTYQGSIAVDRATGNALSQQQILASPVPIEHDDFLIRGLANLKYAGNVTKDTTQGEAAILPFLNHQTGVEVSDEVIQAVKDTVGKALDQALQEITNKTFISNLQSSDNTALFVSGHLAHVSANVDSPDHESLMIAGVGYLIEDRVTQILLKEHGFSKDNFQATIRSTRPDIVMGDGKVLVDLTASNSAGHILDKDQSVWFHPSIQSLEVTYPSLRIEDAKSIIKSEDIDLSAIKTAQAQMKAEQQKFDSDMKNFLRRTTNHITQGEVYQGLSFQAGVPAQRKYVAEQLGITETPAASLKHALLKYDRSNNLLRADERIGLNSDKANEVVGNLFHNATLNEEDDELFKRFKARTDWSPPVVEVEMSDSLA